MYFTSFSEIVNLFLPHRIAKILIFASELHSVNETGKKNHLAG